MCFVCLLWNRSDLLCQNKDLTPIFVMIGVQFSYPKGDLFGSGLTPKLDNLQDLLCVHYNIAFGVALGLTARGLGFP